MALHPDDTDPCLWRQDRPVEAGAHALIIGISDYPYLGGGSAPEGDRAPDNGGLAQLEVSALSGALFFEWLNGAGEIAGAPLATCRLLLAPRPDERAAVDALTGGHYGGGDYEPMRTALMAWADDVAAGGRTAGPNVALFFFSGHGVEVAASPALLARDALNQRSADGGTNKALAVETMSMAIKTYNIDRGLLFVDACRDSPKVARLLNLTGDQPLRPNPHPKRRPDALIRLQSTASGLKSYQVKEDLGTLFTQAVLDGLNGPPPSYIPYDTTSIPWQLIFSALEGHVKRKVVELLADRSPLAVQSVEPYGNPYNGGMLIARMEGPGRGDGTPVVRRPQIKDPASVRKEAVEASAALVIEGARSLSAEEIDGTRSILSHAVPRGSDLADFGIMQAIFQHETIAESWTESLQFLDARTNKPAKTDMLRIIGAYSQQIDRRLVAWIDLAIAPKEGGALWIGASGAGGSPSSAVVIPQDLRHPIPARLDVTFVERDEEWTLSAMSARLSDPADFRDPIATLWAPLWEAQRTEAFADLASAGRTVEQLLDLQAVVDEKSESPVAAALAINYLLRSGGIDYLLHWPRNLATRFAWLPDGAVLWAETLLRRHELEDDMAAPSAQTGLPDDNALRLLKFFDNPAPREALEYFSMLADRSVPLLANSLAIALRQALLWRSLNDANLLSGRESHRLAQALENVDRAGRYAVSGGSFARFVSPDGMVNPGAVLGEGREAMGHPMAA